MIYYILIPTANNQYLTETIGEVSFKNFWTDGGFDTLYRMITVGDDRLEQLKIKDEKSKEYTIPEFLERISTLNVIRN